jgi:hypothetical protein
MYRSILKAPLSKELVAAYEQARTAHRTRKEFHKARMRSRLRQDFFVRKNAALIEAQLPDGETDPIRQSEAKELAPSTPK